MENPGGNVATATWQKRTLTTGWNSFAAVKVIDIDRDGRADIVLSASESSGKLSWFKGPADPRTGPWVENIIATNLAKVHSIAVVDLDRNGTLDDLFGATVFGVNPVVLYRNIGVP